MDIFKLSALAVTAALGALVLKKEVPALSVVLALAAGVILLGEVSSALGQLRGAADALARSGGLDPLVWKPVWKTVGIGLVTRLSSSVCRDAGEGSLAAFLESAGTALALLCALPLVQTVMDTLGGLV